MKNRKETTKTILLVIIMISAIIATYVINKNRIVKVEEIEVTFTVENTMIMGFDVNNTALTFGKVPRGSTGMRPLGIENNEEFPVTVKIKKLGETAEYLSFSENNFILEPKEKKEITVFATPSPQTPDNIYNGKIKVLFIK